MKRTPITFITLFAATAARASDLATTFYFDMFPLTARPSDAE
jgi:hypothetical protein